MSTVEELREQLRQAELEAARVPQEELKKLPVEWEYIVEWKSKYRFYCSRKLSQKSLAAFDKWRAKFPKAQPQSWLWSQERDRVVGMEYVLIDNLLVQVSGGTLVLVATADKDHFSHEPRPLTPFQASELREGRVPHALRNL